MEGKKERERGWSRGETNIGRKTIKAMIKDEKENERERETERSTEKQIPREETSE